MSHSSKQKTLTHSFRGFRGINKAADHSDPFAAQDILNFRMREDGSLEKREGYRLLTDLGAPIRDFWCGTVRGEQKCYALTENRVLSVNLKSGSFFELGTVENAEGAAHFFFYNGKLFLSDGKNFYDFREGIPFLSCGYVPLVGKDWSPHEIGPAYEPRNLLNRHARISYVMSDPPTMFLPVGEPIESIEAVYVNDSLISSGSYYFDEDFYTVNIPDLSPDDRILVYLTFAQDKTELRQSLASSTHSVIFGGPGKSRLFLWGGNDPTVMFCSAYVSAEQEQQAKRCYFDASCLYIPDGFEFTVGEGRYDIQSAERHYDRLLIFTEGDAWIAQEGASGLEEFPTANVNSQIGCAAKGGSALAENDPVSIGRATVWQWSGETDRLSERNAKRLSAPIDPLLSAEDYRSASLYHEGLRNELWLNIRSRGQIFIYNLAQKGWVRWSGIYADRFFEADGVIGFWRDGKIFVFDPAMTEDFESDTDIRPIAAIYESGLIDFGDARRKNLSRALLDADMDDGSLRVSFFGNGTKELRQSFSEKGQTHSSLCRRFSGGSFRYGTARILSEDRARPILHSLTLICR